MWRLISIPGRSVSRRRISGPSGITLIELMVTMAIVGVIVVLAVGGMRTAFDVELKTSASQLASLIRYLRIHAVTQHEYLRLGFDLRTGEYWVEKTKEMFVIPTEQETKDLPAQTETKAAFEKGEEKLFQKKSLGSGVRFKDLKVSYLPEMRQEGEVYLYFFPDGYATPAMIHLQDEEDESHYSLEVFPYTGKVKIVGEYRDWQKE